MFLLRALRVVPGNVRKVFGNKTLRKHLGHEPCDRAHHGDVRKGGCLAAQSWVFGKVRVEIRKSGGQLRFGGYLRRVACVASGGPIGRVDIQGARRELHPGVDLRRGWGVGGDRVQSGGRGAGAGDCFVEVNLEKSQFRFLGRRLIWARVSRKGVRDRRRVRLDVPYRSAPFAPTTVSFAIVTVNFAPETWYTATPPKEAAIKHFKAAGSLEGTTTCKELASPIGPATTVVFSAASGVGAACLASVLGTAGVGAAGGARVGAAGTDPAASAGLESLPPIEERRGRS